MGGFGSWLMGMERASSRCVSEVVDIAPDVGDVSVARTRLGYRAVFSHMGTDFSVDLRSLTWHKPEFAKDARGRQMTLDLRGMIIAFEDEEGWEASGKFGMEAFGAYGKILLAIKKCLESAEAEDPDSTEFLRFSGWDDKMNLLYDRFYRKHLAGRYTRVDNDNYVRNDVLQRVHGATGGASVQSVARGQKEAEEWLDTIKKTNKEERRDRGAR